MLGGGGGGGGGGSAMTAGKAKNDDGGGAITTGGKSKNDSTGGAITQEKGPSRRGSAIPGLAALQAAMNTSRRGSRTSTPAQYANIGPGLGDLLTHGDPANAYDLSQNNDEYYDARMDRIEALLQQLLAGQSPTGAQATATRSRDSDITLEGTSSTLSGKDAKPYEFPARTSVESPAPIRNNNVPATTVTTRQGIAEERDLNDVEAGRAGNLDALAGHISRERLNDPKR